jgi:hypothetical protein
MDYRHDVDLLLQHPVNDPIRVFKHLPKRFILVLRNHPAQMGESASCPVSAKKMRPTKLAAYCAECLAT